MTDKQIIIDGVDVADCEHINACDKKMKCVILQDDVCEINPYCEGFNCYYKQLKRKEQECEELDNEAQNLFTEKTNLDIELGNIKKERDSYIDKYFLESQKVVNLRKVLREIKEIAKKQCVCGVNCQDMKIILQKISEVEDGFHS